MAGCSTNANVDNANVDQLFLDENEYLIKLYGFSNNDYIKIEDHLVKLGNYKKHKLISSTSLKKNFIYETFSDNSQSQINKDLINVLNLIDIEHSISYDNKKFSIKSKNIRLD